MRWKKGGGGGGECQSIDLTIGVWDVLGTMQVTSKLFKTLTNFTFEELDELASSMVPTIRAHAKSAIELLLSYFIFLILIFEA
jgi:hypothetical protein